MALLGAEPGYRTFSSAISVSSSTFTYYCITSGVNWEVGVGYLASSTSLVRQTVLSSTNAGALVNFSAGTKQVFVTQPSSKIIAVLPNDTTGTTAVPDVSISSSPYWLWQYSLCCNTYSIYYGLRIGNSVTLGSQDTYTAFLHDTQYSGNTTATTYGYKSEPTTGSSLTSNGSSSHYGFYAAGVTPNVGGFRYATTSNCFYADSSIGFANTFQFFANGTDPSQFNGDIRGAAAITSSSASAGVGYRSGAGSTQTQSSNKSTGVTLNNVCGQITMASSALAATTSVSFTLTNSRIAATDVVIVNIASAATTNTYQLSVDAVAAGSCRIHLRNVSTTSRSEALVLNFAVIKAVAS
jgi:hypothetical protein